MSFLMKTKKRSQPSLFYMQNKEAIKKQQELG